MYKISLLTGKIYLNEIEIIQDDRLQDWNDYIQWLQDGNVPEQIDSMPAEILAQNQQRIKEISAYYRDEINKIVLPYLPDFCVFGIPLPQNITDQWNILKNECDVKIKEIDPTQSMSKPGQVKTQNTK